MLPGENKRKKGGDGARNDYENLRQQRLEENKQRMADLGFRNLTNQLSGSYRATYRISSAKAARTRASYLKSASNISPLAPRRFSRQQIIERLDMLSDREMPEFDKRVKRGIENEKEVLDPNKMMDGGDGAGAGVGNDYEKLRQLRLEENKQRMADLGILNLSNQLSSSYRAKSRISSAKAANTRASHFKCLSNITPRRSSRVTGSPRVSYKMLVDTERGNSRTTGHQSKRIKRSQGSRPELYTDEDRKLLGSCNQKWELFKDGYDDNGTRIYDSLKGKTCHQCRQKTMGHRTRCSQCTLVSGQFCGDCLYMRYGENVLEALRNENWVCPVCRGICNCSFCRPKQGWAATGSLYRKVVSLGFKSVAHYLMETLRASAPASVSSVAEEEADNTKPSLPDTKPKPSLETVRKPTVVPVKLQCDLIEQKVHELSKSRNDELSEITCPGPSTPPQKGRSKEKSKVSNGDSSLRRPKRTFIQGTRKSLRHRSSLS